MDKISEKKRSVSGGDSAESTALDIGHDGLITSNFFQNITIGTEMNISQISSSSVDTNSQAKSNLNITHNVGGVSMNFYLNYLTC